MNRGNCGKSCYLISSVSLERLTRLQNLGHEAPEWP